MNTRAHLVDGEIKQIFSSNSWIEPKLSANGLLKTKFLIGDHKPSLLKVKLKNDLTTLAPLLKVHCNSYYSQNAPSFDAFCRPPYPTNISSPNKLYDHVVVTARPEYVSPYSNGSFTTGYKKWQKGKVIGTGSYGIVYEGYNE